jgi:hypothetical protein
MKDSESEESLRFLLKIDFQAQMRLRSELALWKIFFIGLGFKKITLF